MHHSLKTLSNNNRFGIICVSCMVWSVCIMFNNSYIIEGVHSDCHVLIYSKIENELKEWKINSLFIINFDKLGGNVKDKIIRDFGIQSTDGAVSCSDDDLSLEIHRFESVKFNCRKHCDFNAWSSLILDSQVLNNHNVELSFTVTRNYNIVLIKVMVAIRDATLHNLNDLSEVIGDFNLEAKILNKNHEIKRFDFSELILNYRTNVYLNLINKIAIINDSPTISICVRNSNIAIIRFILIIFIPLLILAIVYGSFEVRATQESNFHHK